MTRAILLATTALLASPAWAQETPAPTAGPSAEAVQPSAGDEEEEDVDQEITVQGQRPT